MSTEPREPHKPTQDEPRAGETWRYGWLFCLVKAVGPKTVTYISHGDRSYGEVRRIPKERFMERFRRTNMPIRRGEA